MPSSAVGIPPAQIGFLESNQPDVWWNQPASVEIDLDERFGGLSKYLDDLSR